MLRLFSIWFKFWLSVQFKMEWDIEFLGHNVAIINVFYCLMVPNFLLLLQSFLICCFHYFLPKITTILLHCHATIIWSESIQQWKIKKYRLNFFFWNINVVYDGTNDSFKRIYVMSLIRNSLLTYKENTPSMC